MTQSFEQETQAPPQAQEKDFHYVPPGTLSAIEAASLNQAIVSAHRFPRRIDAVKKRMFEFATLDVETAEACNYELKRKNKRTGETKTIVGETIRMAELAAAAYGNIDTGSRVVEILDGFVSCQGVAHDLETGFRTTTNVYNRILVPGPDGIALAAAAGCSKALRNAILTVVPRALVRPIAKAALSVAAGDSKTMEARRKDKIKDFGNLGVSKERLFEYLGVKSQDEIGVDQYKEMVAVLQAIKDGETTVAEEFSTGPKKPEFEQQGQPPIPPQPEDLQRKVTQEDFDRLKEQVERAANPVRPGGRPKTRLKEAAQAVEKAETLFKEESKPKEEPNLEPAGFATQVAKLLGTDAARIEAFWQFMDANEMGSGGTHQLENVTQEHLESLVDNWASVEVMMKQFSR